MKIAASVVLIFVAVMQLLEESRQRIPLLKFENKEAKMRSKLQTGNKQWRGEANEVTTNE